MVYMNAAIVWLLIITIIMVDLQSTIECRHVDDLEAIGYFDEDYATRRKKLDRDTKLLAKKYKSNVRERSMVDDYSDEGLSDSSQVDESGAKNAKKIGGDDSHWTKSKIVFYVFLGSAAFMFLFFVTTLVVMTINEFVVGLEEKRRQSSSSLSDIAPPKQQSTSGVGYSQKTSDVAARATGASSSKSETAKTLTVVAKVIQ